MKVNEAIVLAGGLGTRLRGVLPDIPKCMALVNDKPFLHYVLSYLGSAGFSKVILSVGYRKEQIISHFGNEFQSIQLAYAPEDEPLGTGGAVMLASRQVQGDSFFVVNGDTCFIPNLQAMAEEHIRWAADVTIAARYMENTARYGLLDTNDQGRILAFREKDPLSEPGYINGGIYLMGKQIFNGITETRFSIEQDIFRVKAGSLRLQAYYSEAFFLDMGIPEDYLRAGELFREGGIL
jgi:D-glycero-alpha-D-manno-heptose 1-phosphate guanylyltransferase